MKIQKKKLFFWVWGGGVGVGVGLAVSGWMGTEN